jgi:Protein of unknown function (DUF3999)
MNRASKLLLIFALVAIAAPINLSTWMYRKKISLTPSDGIAVVRLDREVYAAIGSRYYKMRVYRDNQEIPYIFGSADHVPTDRVRSNEQLFDESIVPDVGLQFTVHRSYAGAHNQIAIFTDLKNFRNRVRIETSQDGVHWSVARNDGAIFNFSQDGREFSSTSVEYPVSRRPFLRATIFGWTKNGSVTGAAVDHKEEQPEVFEVYATATPQIFEDSSTKSTVVQIDLGLTGLPVNRLRLQSSSPQFQRAVGVETSDDAQSWQFGGGGTIARLPGPEFTEESLTISAGGGHRYFRLRIYNRDDQPIKITQIQAEGSVNQLKFLTQASGTYWLYYAGPEPELASMPEYDLGNVLARQSLTEHVWTLERQEPSPFYHPPPEPRKPWSEQHPAILYTVLGAAVLALGIATLRFMARLRTPA